MTIEPLLTRLTALASPIMRHPLPRRINTPGHGRLQRQVWRALVAADGRDLTTRELMPWCPGSDIRAVRRAAYHFAVRVDDRRPGRGRPALWRLKHPGLSFKDAQTKGHPHG